MSAGIAIELISPRADLRESYLGLINEFFKNGEELIPFPLKYPTDDFDALLEALEGFSRGIGITKEFVPHSTYWLVQDNKVVLGVSNLRHKLSRSLRVEGGHIGYGIRPSERRKGYATLILRETLQKAKERGIKRALVTCLKGNIGSRGAIIYNGGVLESEELLDGHDDLMQRYWITIDSARPRRWLSRCFGKLLSRAR